MSANKIDGAAQELEAYFLRRMLAEVKTGESNGFAGDTFKEMFDEAIAKQMSEAGGLGLAKTVAAELSGGPTGANGAPVLSATHAARAYKAIAGAAPLSAGTKTSSFGTRFDPIDGHRERHQGVDLATEAGAPVRAAGPGTVIRAESAGGYGNLVVIDHGDGLETRYAHLSSIAVRPGTKVEAGETLGEVGETGHATGPHLHFEVRRDGTAIDPERTGLKLPR